MTIDLGIRIGEIYLKIMREVMEMLKAHPEVEILKPKIEKLRERTISQLIELGREREKLDEATKGKINFDITSKMREIPYSDFKVFSELVNYYRPKDNDLANDIAQFNTITQYADFELLKKQQPKEFERLGL